MALKLAIVAANAAANVVVDMTDEASANGSLVIYDGSEPATPETAISTQVALVTFSLPRPAFGNAVDTADGGLAVINPVDAVLADFAGTASFFRLLDGNGVAILQGSVTDGSGNGDVHLSSTSILANVEVSVISLSYLQPKH